MCVHSNNTLRTEGENVVKLGSRDLATSPSDILVMVEVSKLYNNLNCNKAEICKFNIINNL